MFQKYILIDDVSYTEQDSYLKLLATLNLSELSFNEEELIDRFIANIRWIDNIEVFTELEKIFPTTYRDTINEDYFIEKVSEVIQDEIENTEDSDTYDLIQKVENLENKFSIDYSHEISDLKQKEEDYNGYIESQIDSYIEDRRDFNEPEELNMQEETRIINQIFNSLLDE